ncbi:hypothetical protein OPV22_030549 [Ensete ventricosum]|uniref:Uncharacterized protein n=1 Tax=Ensete ventricosum TaxID=4639 RepID=A0AAV8P8G1_ENSVE|nr:hypothetical protein OPV22_030549 [Ensete ventricosum]
MHSFVKRLRYPCSYTIICMLQQILSDKELALLLYQGLNSSHKVPRMPRVWQAAGLQPTSAVTSTIGKISASIFSGNLTKVTFDVFISVFTSKSSGSQREALDQFVFSTVVDISIT